MHIKSVELKNIRSYREENIEFDRGINFLSGDIGCGKSSILLAIEFALFGFKRGDLEGYQLLRKGEKKGSIKVQFVDSKKNIYEIARTLKRSGSDVVSQGNGYVKIKNETIEFAPTELNAYVFNLFNFPIEFLSKDKNLIYRFTIYTAQEQLKEILFATNDSRLEVIRKIFGIDKYKQLQNAISIYNPKIRDTKKTYEIKIEELPKLKEELKQIQEQNKNASKDEKLYQAKEKDFNEKLTKFKDALKTRETKIEVLQKQIHKIENTKNLIDKIDKDIKDKKRQLEIIEKGNFEEKIKQAKQSIQTKEKDLKSKEIIKSNLEKSLKERNKIQEELSNLKEQLIKYESQEKRIQDLAKNFDYVLTKCKIKDLENYIKTDESNIIKIEKIEKEFEAKTKLSIQIESQIQNMQKQIDHTIQKIKQIDKMHKCNLCLQEVDSKHKKEIVRNLKEEKKEQEQKIKDLTKELKNLTKDISKIDAQKTIAQHSKQKLDLNKEKIKILKQQEKKEKLQQKELQDLKQELQKQNKNDIDLKLDTLKKKLKEFEKVEQELEKILKEEQEITNYINETKLKISNTEKKISQKDIHKKDITILKKDKDIHLEEFKTYDTLIKTLDSKSKELQKQTEDRIKINNAIEKLHENLRLVSNKISSLKTQSKTNETLIRKNEEKINKIKEFETKLKQTIELENFLNKDVIDITSKIERNLFTKYYLEFNEEFERLFRELIEDNEIDVRLDAEFSPIIEQNGFDIDIKNLSGGEKSSLAVAYRLGLKKIIEQSFIGSNQLNLLILDEPTDGFSNEQVVRLGNILRDTKLDQIIIVSHDEKVEGIADKVLKVDKVNHVSRVV